MTPTDKLLLGLLSRALFDGPCDPLPSDTDYPLLLKEALHHTVAPLVYDALTPQERAALPPDLARFWQMQVMGILWNNEQLAAEQRTVLAALEGAGIPCVLMKGSSSAMNYPKPELRCAGDIDLLLSPTGVDRAQSLLLTRGYTGQEEEGSHRAMHRGPFIIELHHAPAGLPHTPTGDALRGYFRGCEDIPLLREGLPVLPPAQRAVLLLAHKLEHITTSGLGLRQLCDWAVFVHRELSPQLWEELTPTLKAFGLYAFGLAVTRACIAELGLPRDAAPWCLEGDGALARALMEDILQSGNFGHKENRYGQRLFTDPQSGSRWSSFLRTGVRVCREHWSPCDRNPLLLPIAPAVLLWRYVKQRRAGERPPLRPLNAYQGAERRQKLYQQLRPFQPEE